MQDKAPDFSNQLNSGDFRVEGTDEFGKRLDQASQGVKDVQYDWSNVNALLSQLASGQAFADARAKGEGLTAGDRVRMGQANPTAVGNSPQDLGKALMQLGSKASAGQAMQVADAQGQQQMQAMEQAAALRRAQAEARMAIYKQELALQDQKFQMQQAVTKMKDGLEIANLQLRNMFNSAVSKAKNAQDLGDLAVQHTNFDEVMGYLSVGLGAASSAAAAGAASLTQPAATSANSAGTGKLGYLYGGGSTGDTPTYGGMVSSSSGGGYFSNPTPVTNTTLINDFWGRGGAGA